MFAKKEQIEKIYDYYFPNQKQTGEMPNIYQYQTDVKENIKKIKILKERLIAQ